MSLAESFLNTARDLLMMSENIKRMDSRIDRIAADLAGVDRRLMKIELMVDLAKEEAKARSPQRLT
jgi:hypothetical protein